MNTRSWTLRPTNQPKKRPKIRFRPNSSTRKDANIDESLGLVWDTFSENDIINTNYNTFKQIIENALEKDTSIRELYKQAYVTLTSLFD